jgi:hypothetical protein
MRGLRWLIYPAWISHYNEHLVLKHLAPIRNGEFRLTDESLVSVLALFTPLKYHTCKSSSADGEGQ